MSDTIPILNFNVLKQNNIVIPQAYGSVVQILEHQGVKIPEEKRTIPSNWSEIVYRKNGVLPLLHIEKQAIVYFGVDRLTVDFIRAVKAHFANNTCPIAWIVIHNVGIQQNFINAKPLTVMLYSELYMNKLAHILVPNTHKLSEVGVQNIDQQLQLKIPKIKENEPLCRVLGAKKGDVIRFDRTHMSDEAKYYRKVV